MATRGATDAKRAQRVRIGRATGSHSVHRFVCAFFIQQLLRKKVRPRRLYTFARLQ
jgi:hypothetical protein